MPQSNRFIHFILLVISLTSIRQVLAQTGNAGPSHELISTAQGLSQGLINDMIQDRDGFLWIATKGGLNRYDGYSFKVYTNDPENNRSISSNSISNLLEDSRGRIWAGTFDGGLNVFDKTTGRFTRIVHKAGDAAALSSNRIIASLVELPDGKMLVAPQGGSMQSISLAGKDSMPPVITNIAMPPGKEIFGVQQDDKAFIWVAFTDYSIFIFNPSTLSFDLLSNGDTLTSLISKVGTRLVARSNAVNNLEPAPNIFIGFSNQSADIFPGIISEIRPGSLGIAGAITLQAGSNGAIFSDFTGAKAGTKLKDIPCRQLNTSVPFQSLKSLLLDKSGVLWVGTMGHGIYKYKPGVNRFKPALTGMSVQKLTVIDPDNIYVQGWNSVTNINASGIEIASRLKAISSPHSNIFRGRNGDYWTNYDMSKKALNVYSPDLKLKATFNEPVNATSTEQLQPMIEDKKGRIWVCGSNGTLAMVNPLTSKLISYTIKSEETTSQTLTQTTAFYEDGKGVFWMGTEHGFARLEFAESGAEPVVRWYKNQQGDKNSLNYNYVSWFMDDPANGDQLWVSTKGGGLNRLDKSTGHFVHYTSKQGLPNDVVYGTLTDRAGNIWGSTNRGLFCMMAGTADSSAGPVFRIFSTSDGLQADEFNTNALAKLPDGQLVFGGVNGVNIFHPEEVLANTFIPKVFITGIQIGNKNIVPGDASNVLKETIEKTRSITLNHQQDVLTLEFSSLDFTAPLQNKYRYQLVGIDKEWVESDTRRSATYLHLPAGKYIFKVQGSNSQGIWNNEPTILEITVLPPWWRSWWAYLLYAAITAVLIRAYMIFNVKKAKLESQLSFEQREAKRIKELDTIKTQLYTNITHEFRTPVTVIMGMAQQVLEKPAEQFENRMQMIVRNGRNLLNLVNEMLDLSKLETGKMELQLSQGDVIHFLRYVVESFHSLADTQKKHLHFLTDLDVLYMEYDKEKLRQIVSNLLSNAIKFTPENGNIYISVMETQGNDETTGLLIKVKDTGIGIPEDKIDHIFDRFYQLDNSHTRSAGGTGIGLALTKELVRLMNGSITVKSPPAGITRGTEFSVSLMLRHVDPVVEAIEEEWKSDAHGTAVIANISSATLQPVITEGRNARAPLILLVEDNADVVAYTASCLPEYRLAVGKDGREGLEIAIDLIPDLIITDVMMPFMDGFELVAKLRENEFTSHIPVIMLTAKADLPSRIEGLQRGAEAYLEKPFIKEELLVRISQLLELRKKLQHYYLSNAGILQVVAEAVHTGDDTLPMAPQKKPEKPEDPFVANVRNLIEQNMTATDFTVERLCKLVFMSHSQFHRKLEALTGCSPNKFIRMLRLKRALELLPDTSKSIGSISLDCGYNDPGYFARVFRQEFGMTPQEWRTGKS